MYLGYFLRYQLKVLFPTIYSAYRHYRGFNSAESRFVIPIALPCHRGISYPEPRKSLVVCGSDSTKQNSYSNFYSLKAGFSFLKQAYLDSLFI